MLFNELIPKPSRQQFVDIIHDGLIRAVESNSLSVTELLNHKNPAAVAFSGKFIFGINPRTEREEPLPEKIRQLSEYSVRLRIMKGHAVPRQCPNCERIVSKDEKSCFECGTTEKKFKPVFWFKVGKKPDKFVQEFGEGGGHTYVDDYRIIHPDKNGEIVVDLQTAIRILKQAGRGVKKCRTSVFRDVIWYEEIRPVPVKKPGPDKGPLAALADEIGEDALADAVRDLIASAERKLNSCPEEQDSTANMPTTTDSA